MKHKASSDESLPSSSSSSLVNTSIDTVSALPGSTAAPKRNKSILPLFKRRKSAEPAAISAALSSPSILPTPPTSGSPRGDDDDERSTSTGCSPRAMKKSSSGSSSHSTCGLAGPQVAAAAAAAVLASPPVTPPASQMDGYAMLAEIFKKNGGALVLFTDFCEQHYCDELVHCYQAVMDFKSADKTPDEELQVAAERISELYLRYGSNQEVNATVGSVHAIQQSIKDKTVTRKTLDPLLADITPLLLQELILLKSTNQKDRLMSLFKADSRY